MRTDPHTCFQLLETLLFARAGASAEGRDLSPADYRTLWAQGDGAAADAAAICLAADPVATFTACLLAEGVLSPGELAHLHQRVHHGRRQGQPAAAVC
jgi:hypothetical protein